MRTLIAVPCMDMVHTAFMVSLVTLVKKTGAEVAFSSSSLVYEARQMLAQKAVAEKYDRVLWIDSDMRFRPDILERLSAHLDAGLEFVSGLYFTRKNPTRPVIYKTCESVTTERGEVVPETVPYYDYPDGLFEIEGCGFGICMVTTDLISRCGDCPFYPVLGFGEDFSFCLRAKNMGAKIYCDSRIRADHIATGFINESSYKRG